MIKQTSKKKLWPALQVFSLFILCYIIRLNLIVPSLLLLAFAYLKLRRIDLKNFSLLNAALLLLLILGASHFILRQGFPAYYIPFSAIPLAATLLFNSLEISLLITLVTSLSVASFSRSPLELSVLFMVSGLFSSMLTLGARKRNTIIRSGIIVGLAQVVTLIFLDNLVFHLPGRYSALFLNGVVSAIVVLGALPVFEYLFSTVTNISLLELADFHHPLLQRMILEAPGTFHHSLVVGNLSESACEAIGANALLARVGAYYHDIGKLQKATYFSENQDFSASKHDTLAPTMSKMIIMNHVKEGVELAKKYKMSPPLIDFIRQHHGNSLVFYFYRRALEGLEEDQEIQEEGFRYPGPKPSSKEAAVILLADSVEAATRALREPNPAGIQEVVHKVINNKFIDGQLDECDLTLKDLEKISCVFNRILSGIYHSRISYPEESRSEPR